MSISVENLSHCYNKGSEPVLKEIDLKIKKGEIVGIIGQSGSGKSTLVQHFNALLKPTSGAVYLDDCDINGKGVKKSFIRRRVGMLFQYPEQQLFEETVFLDVAFGLSRLKCSSEVVKERVEKALRIVGLDPEEVASKSPLHLSGGEKRRVALAGVLVMEPDYLILDEPTANLDPRGREAVLELILELNKSGITIILVSHAMEEVARLVDKIFILKEGRLELAGNLEEVFGEREKIEKTGLALPETIEVLQKIKELGKNVDVIKITPALASEEILKLIGENKCSTM